MEDKTIKTLEKIMYKIVIVSFIIVMLLQFWNPFY